MYEGREEVRQNRQEPFTILYVYIYIYIPDEIINLQNYKIRMLTILNLWLSNESCI